MYTKLHVQSYYVHKVTFYITSYSMNATETTLLHFYLISMFVLCDECHVYINSLESTGDNGRQPPLLPPRPRATRVDTRIHNYRLSAAP